MAWLRKREGSNVWQAQYYVPDAETGGLRQVRKSTGQTNKKLAKAAAIELERTALGTIEAGTDASRLAKAVLAEAVAEIERETFTGLSARSIVPPFARVWCPSILVRRPSVTSRHPTVSTGNHLAVKTLPHFSRQLQLKSGAV